MQYPHDALRMIMFCVCPILQHDFAMVPMDIGRDTFVQAHSDILLTVGAMCGFTEEQSLHPDFAEVVELPRRLGGLGITNPEVVGDRALITNYVVCVQALKDVPNLCACVPAWLPAVVNNTPLTLTGLSGVV